MRALIRTSLLALPFAALILVACSKPGANPQAAGSQPTVSAPTQQMPAEAPSPRTEKTEATKAEQHRKAGPVVPAPKPSIKKEQKTSKPSTAVAENAQPAPMPPLPPAAPSPIVAPPEQAPPVAPEIAPPPPAAAPRQVTIPAGAIVSVRTIDSVDSRTDHVGQTFRASVDSDVVVDDQIAVPRGADAVLKLTQVSSAGELRGKSELQLELDRFVTGTKSYSVESSTIQRSAAPQGAKTARDAAIGAAIGAVIGAIAGGGKGAAIGAGAGAGAGVAVAAITKGEQVLVASETRLDFRLERAIEIELQALPFSPATQNRFRPRKVTDLSGEWDLSVVGLRGSRTFNLFLEQKGNNLSGTINSLNGETRLRGKVDGDTVTFTTESSLRGRTIQSNYSGTITENRLRGRVTIRIMDRYPGRFGPRLPSEQSMQWSAERVLP